MLHAEWLIPLTGLGIGFIVLGIYLITRARADEGGYFTTIFKNPDVRKFLERQSPLAFISLKVGGRISISVGVGLLILTAILWCLR